MRMVLLVLLALICLESTAQPKLPLIMERNTRGGVLHPEKGSILAP